MMTRATPSRTSPHGKFAGEDAVDDGGHQLALGGGGLFAADALGPLDEDLVGGGVHEVFAVGERGGADGVEQGVAVAVADGARGARWVGRDRSLGVSWKLSREKGPLFWTPSARSCGVTRMGWGRRWKVSRPLFMALSVAPIEKTEMMTPAMTAACCFQGVAPMR